MSSSALGSAIGVLVLAGVHLVAGHLHRGAPRRPSWLSAAGGMSIAYVFVHLLPDLNETQQAWLEARPARALDWLDTQIYLAALLGVVLAVALDRVTRTGRRRRFWVHTGAFAIYNALIGGFALRVHGLAPLVLAVIAFGAHFVINDHSLYVQYGRAYERAGRWVLAAAIVLGWLVATLWSPPVVMVAAMLGLVSGGIIVNVIKEELPGAHSGRLSPWVAGALGYALLLLTLTYAQRAEPEQARATQQAATQHRPRGESADPLPSWNEGAAKSAIIRFVTQVTRKGSPDYVAPGERIAVFDNDGTLWVEQPMYTQLAFALDRVKQLAPEHPEWRTEEPFAAILAGDIDGVAASGHRGIVELVAATHADITSDEFEQIVERWLATARHPTLHRPYTELVYAPMLELLAYLRTNGFTTFIVSGGGVDFIRPWTERVYGVRREQVVGSRIEMRYETRDGVPVLMRLPTAAFVDDKAGKPVGIEQAIGRRPLVAFGNSDGDFEMLEWTTSGPGPRLGVLVHHTDAEREWAYDREAKVGQLSRALDAAPQRGWVIVDMKRDWRRIFREPSSGHQR